MRRTLFKGHVNKPEPWKNFDWVEDFGDVDYLILMNTILIDSVNSVFCGMIVCDTTYHNHFLRLK